MQKIQNTRNNQPSNQSNKAPLNGKSLQSGGLNKFNKTVGDAIERVGDTVEQAGFKHTGEVIERLGDRVEHMNLREMPIVNRTINGATSAFRAVRSHPALALAGACAIGAAAFYLVKRSTSNSVSSS